MIQTFLYNDILNTFIITGIIIGYLIVVTIISKIFTTIYINKLQLNTPNNILQWFYYLSLGFTPIISSIVLGITCFRKINLSKYSYKVIKYISILIFTFICIKIYIWDIYGFYFVTNHIQTPFNNLIISIFNSTEILKSTFIYFNILDPF